MTRGRYWPCHYRGVVFPFFYFGPIPKPPPPPPSLCPTPVVSVVSFYTYFYHTLPLSQFLNYPHIFTLYPIFCLSPLSLKQENTHHKKNYLPIPCTHLLYIGQVSIFVGLISAAHISQLLSVHHSLCIYVSLCILLLLLHLHSFLLLHACVPHLFILVLCSSRHSR